MKAEEGSSVWSQSSPSPPDLSWLDCTCADMLPRTLREPRLSEALSRPSLCILPVVKGLHYEKEVPHLTKQAHDRDTGWRSLVLQRNAVNALTSSKSGPQGWDSGARGVGDRVQDIGLPSPHKWTGWLAYLSSEQDDDIIK